MARTANIKKLNHLGKMRIQKGLTRECVANIVKVSIQFLSQIESITSNKKPSVETAKKLCTLYGCTLENIYKVKTKNRKNVG